LFAYTETCVVAQHDESFVQRIVMTLDQQVSEKYSAL